MYTKGERLTDRRRPPLPSLSHVDLQFYNSYIRAETVAHAMIHQLTSPPPEFADVIKAHFRKAWHTLIRRDLLAWGERNDLVAPEGAATDPGWGASQSQIHRMAWFRAAQGPGNYKKLILQEVAKMDELVAALGGAVMVMPDAGAEGGGGVAADLREEAAGAAGGGGGKSDGRAAAASSAASAAAMATAVAGSGKAGSSGSGSCVQGVRF